MTPSAFFVCARDILFSWQNKRQPEDSIPRDHNAQYHRCTQAPTYTNHANHRSELDRRYAQGRRPHSVMRKREIRRLPLLPIAH